MARIRVNGSSQQNLPSGSNTGSQRGEKQQKTIENETQTIIVESPKNLPREKRVPPTAIPPMLDSEAKDAHSKMAVVAVDVVTEDKIKGNIDGSVVASTSAVVEVGTEVKKDINTNFVVDATTYAAHKGEITKLVACMEPFDTVAFLSGLKSSPNTRLNEYLLNQSVETIQLMAKEISDSNGITLKEAYQQIVGLVDTFDEEQKTMDNSIKLATLSSFPVRSAILLASQRSGAGLASWEAYTKTGKPKDNIWPFVENWKNWVPEAQGTMAKFMETTFIESRKLADAHPRDTVYLLKGGFGAGKTRQLKKLFDENAAGAIAPDKGKRVVRRSMPEITHSAAHVQGSQVAYALFEEIMEMPGTAVYDSSLSNPKDLIRYVKKAENVGKNVIVYDVTRKDIARTLAVLKRGVGGEDPRIPPERISSATHYDRLNRVKCMEAILSHEAVSPNTVPEYHFIAGNSKGWDSRKVAILTPESVRLLAEAHERMEVEGVRYDRGKGTFHSTVDKKKLDKYFNTRFEQNVRTVMRELSSDEKSEIKRVFSGRTISFNTADLSKLNQENFYSFLSTDLKVALSENDVKRALESVSENTLRKFMDKVKCKGGRGITYLDLPLKVALIMHESLKVDPWTAS